MPRNRRSLDPNERLRDSERWQTNVTWAVAIDMRLGYLVEKAEDAGESLNRSDLLAALVLDAKPDGQRLGQLVRRMRRGTVSTALPELAEGGKVISLPDRKPGRSTR